MNAYYCIPKSLDTKPYPEPDNFSPHSHIQFLYNQFYYYPPVAYPGILFGRGSTNSVEDRGQRERGSGGGSPLVRGSGGSCNLVKAISFHIVKFS